MLGCTEDSPASDKAEVCGREFSQALAGVRLAWPERIVGTGEVEGREEGIPGVCVQRVEKCQEVGFRLV